VLELAGSDERVVAGAVVGSLAHGEGDRWSDLDLTFAVADGVNVEAALDDWTRRLADELEAVRLFDVWGGAELLRALAAAVDGLVREAGELGSALEPQLRSISEAR
jgi:hypothetical protein